MLSSIDSRTCGELSRKNCGRVRAAAVFIVVVFGLSANVAEAQSREKGASKKDSVSGQELESRVTKAETALLREYMDVVNEYYKQGDKEAAVQVLQRVSAINPKMDGVNERISSISEELLQENGLKFELDVSKSWVPVCDVTEGKPIRLVAAGEYKLDLNSVVPVAGLSTADPAKDHVAAAPFGALIGLVVTDGKPGDPFVVNASGDHSPKKSGQLFLRVNVPATAKCKGELKLQLSGGIKPLIKKR